MKPLKVYLCDLTHDTIILVSDTIPLNIGYVGSYAKKKHGDSVEISLFKYPNITIETIKKEPPDVLALSNYTWNSLLSEQVAKIAKSVNPKVITVQGGPNFPHQTELQLEFLKKRPNTDFHIELEGEVSFSNLLDRIIKYRRGDQELFHTPIDGCAFVNKQGSIVKGTKPPRVQFLDDIPSPWLNGMLDKFFDGRLSPLIETNRGCPFKCSFCHTGNDYFQKVHMLSMERIRKELEYVGERAYKKKNTILHLADVNFGMFPRDREICEIISETQKKYQWPTTVVTSTGKNNKERVIDVTKILGNTFTITMAVQSMDEKVLSNINRSNIKLDHFVGVNKHLQKEGRTSTGELIVGLPGETKESFKEGVKKIIDSGVNKITIYTLMMLYGTEFKNYKYRERFKMKGKFRIVPLNIGEYGGTKVFDYEEVCIENKDMSFEDYLEMRQLSLIAESIYNNQTFEVFFRYALTLGISRSDFLMQILSNLNLASKKINQIFSDFTKESKDELWESEEELVNYYQKEENYQKLLTGKAGGNLIYKYKSMNLATAMEDWTEYLTLLLKNIVDEKYKKEIKPKSQEIQMLAEYHKQRTWKFLDKSSSNTSLTMDSDYNFIEWLEQSESKPLSMYRLKKPIRFYFAYTELQKKERYDQFRRYGASINGLSKIVTRIKVENLLRSVGTNPNTISDNMITKRSRTRYAMST